MTGSDEQGIRRSLERAVGFVEDMHLAQVIACEVDTLRMPSSTRRRRFLRGEEARAWDENLGGGIDEEEN